MSHSHWHPESTLSTMALAQITQHETSLVKNINPVITVLERRDFSHVKQSLRDHIYIIFETTLPRTVHRQNIVFIPHQKTA